MEMDITEPSKIKSLHDIAKNILIYSLKLYQSAKQTNK